VSVGGGSERARALGSRVTRNETKRGGKAKTNSPRVVRPKGRRKSRRLATAGDARGDGAGRSAARGSIAEEGEWDEARTGAVLFHAGGERRGLFLRPRRGRLARGGLGLGLLLLGLRWRRRGGCGRVVSQNKSNFSRVLSRRGRARGARSRRGGPVAGRARRIARDPRRARDRERPSAGRGAETRFARIAQFFSRIERETGIVFRRARRGATGAPGKHAPPPCPCPCSCSSQPSRVLRRVCEGTRVGARALCAERTLPAPFPNSVRGRGRRRPFQGSKLESRN